MDIILNITCQVNAFYSLESQQVTVHKSITVSNHQSVTDLLYGDNIAWFTSIGSRYDADVVTGTVPGRLA